MNYEFVPDDTIQIDGHTLKRIRLVREMNNILYEQMPVGTLGGYIESERNLDNGSDGDAWVADGAFVYGNAHVTGSSYIAMGARVCDDAIVANGSVISGGSVIRGKSALSMSNIQRSIINTTGRIESCRAVGLTANGNINIQPCPIKSGERVSVVNFINTSLSGNLNLQGVSAKNSKIEGNFSMLNMMPVDFTYLAQAKEDFVDANYEFGSQYRLKAYSMVMGKTIIGKEKALQAFKGSPFIGVFETTDFDEKGCSTPEQQAVLIPKEVFYSIGKELDELTRFVNLTEYDYEEEPVITVSEYRKAFKRLLRMELGQEAFDRLLVNAPGGFLTSIPDDVEDKLSDIGSPNYYAALLHMAKNQMETVGKSATQMGNKAASTQIQDAFEVSKDMMTYMLEGKALVPSFVEAHLKALESQRDEYLSKLVS